MNWWSCLCSFALRGCPSTLSFFIPVVVYLVRLLLFSSSFCSCFLSLFSLLFFVTCSLFISFLLLCIFFFSTFFSLSFFFLFFFLLKFVFLFYCLRPSALSALWFLTALVLFRLPSVLSSNGFMFAYNTVFE